MRTRQHEEEHPSFSCSRMCICGTQMFQEKKGSTRCWTFPFFVEPGPSPREQTSSLVCWLGFCETKA
jgi:hypothetical protein